MTDILIIGAGPAGLTAAIYALRAGLEVTLVESDIYGGQMAITNTIENYPGLENVTGSQLSNNMYKQVLNMGGKLLFKEVVSVNLLGKIKVIKTSSGDEIESYSVIIANGLKRRKLGCDGEEKFTGRGVSYCAVCDGAFFKNKNVVVVGGGNTAAEDAIYLSNICKNVTLIVRKNYFRAEKYLCNLVDKKENINTLMESKITKIKGENIVNSVEIKTGNNNDSELDVEGVFIAIGYEPDNKIYFNQVEMDKNMYFVAGEDCTTNIPGVYVAGDCRLKPIRQIVTAASDGAVAGTMAIRFVSSLK